MSGYNVKIATNSKESGDWMIVECEGDEIYSGHSISPFHLFDILRQCNGFEFLEYYELTDEQIQDWPNCLNDIEPTRAY